MYGFLGDTIYENNLDVYKHCVYFEIKLLSFLFLTHATYTMKPNAMQLIQHNTQKSNTCKAKLCHMQYNTEMQPMPPILLMQLYKCLGV